MGVPDERIGETMDVILRAARQVTKPELILDPPDENMEIARFLLGIKNGAAMLSCLGTL